MESRETHSQGYFYIIPASLAESGDFYKAILYGLITSLSRREDDENGRTIFRGCDASNQYLATKLGMKNIGTVSKYINELKNEGWVRVEVDKEAGNKRRIFPTSVEPQPLREDGRTITQKRKGSTVKTEAPYAVKTEESNINKSNINKYILGMNLEERNRLLKTLEKDTETEDVKKHEAEIDEITTYYKSKIGSKLDVAPKLTRQGKEKIVVRIRSFTPEQLKKAIDNFSNDTWWMANNGSRGITWFFKSDQRIEQLINLKPRNATGKPTTDKWNEFN